MRGDLLVVELLKFVDDVLPADRPTLRELTQRIARELVRVELTEVGEEARGDSRCVHRFSSVLLEVPP
jgi:hypothetical protein